MGRTVAARVLELVHKHHRTESGNPVTLEPQWEEVYADPACDMRMIAAAQRGKTLYELVKVYARMSLGMSCGWVMPKENKLTELIHGKYEPTVKNTPLYKMLEDMSEGSNSARLKTFGKTGKLYMVTANSVSELTSFSADAMTVDERDFCNRNNLPMYPKRMNYSPYRHTDEISTPTTEGRAAKPGQPVIDNIHSEFLSGDQHRWFTVCEHCGHWQIVDWYENFVKCDRDDNGHVTKSSIRDREWSPGSTRDLRPCCSREECGRPFDRLGPGQWRALNPGASKRSRWVEPLALSVGPSMADLYEIFSKALGNPSKMQQFHNMDLARPYSSGVQQFDESLFDRCCDPEHHMSRSSDGPCTMGIDVNMPFLDIHISRWLKGKQIKVFVGKVAGGKEEILQLVRSFNVIGVVIDNQPEARFAKELQTYLEAHAKCKVVRCKYATNDQTIPLVHSEPGQTKIDPPRLVTAYRTFYIDSVYESMHAKGVVWFSEWKTALDGSVLAEFRNAVRMLVVNEAGIERYVWEGSPDHQLHAGVYDLLAGEIFSMQIVTDYSEIGPFVHNIVHGPEPEKPVDPRRDDAVMIFRGSAL